MKYSAQNPTCPSKYTDDSSETHAHSKSHLNVLRAVQAGVLGVQHKCHTDELWRKLFCDGNPCLLLLSGVVQVNSSIFVASSHLQIKI